MARDGARRGRINRVERVGAASRTGRQDSTRQVPRNILRSRNGRCDLLMLQGPLLLGPVNLPEIVDTGVALGDRVARLRLLAKREQPLILRLQQPLLLLLLRVGERGLGGLRLRPLGLGLRGLRLLRELLRVVAQLAHLIAQAKQLRRVFAQALVFSELWAAASSVLACSNSARCSWTFWISARKSASSVPFWRFEA